MKKIVLTGGGTAGHVTPNIALLESLIRKNYKVYYIGGKSGMEKDLMAPYGAEYHGISAGKLRRYVDFKNVTDAFKVARGYFEARSILKKIQPDIVFSKGGFVTVPVCFAAKNMGIPLIIHESDITPGLANRLSVPFAAAVCTSFPETSPSIKNENTFLTGIPIRKELFSGNPEKGAKLCGFKDKKPVILIIGGSQGSIKINNCLRGCLTALLKSYNIVHICGKKNLDEKLSAVAGYAQFEYIDKELKDVFALADIVVSRSGAGSIYEFLALKKPNLLIPLSRAASRGDQILNARSFEKQGYSKVLPEEELTEATLKLGIIDLYSTRERYIEAMGKSGLKSGVEEVMSLIVKNTK